VSSPSSRLLALGVLCAVSACDSGPLGPGEKRALAEARERWSAAGITSYRVEVRVSCFCIHALPGFTELEIRDGQVVAAQAVEPDPDVETIPLEVWPTVSEAFEAIGRASDDGDVYASIEAEYDADLGFPRLVSLRCHENILDCGLTYEFRNLEPLDSGS
jgi:hypothetical protein